MNNSRVRPALMLLAPAVMILGLTACAQSASPPDTAASTAKTPGPESAPPPSSSTALTAPAPRTLTSASSAASAHSGESASTIVRRVPSTPCLSEQRWGTGPRAGSTAMSPSALYLTRVGRHACYDRVVFDINGPQAVGLAARYVPVVLVDPTGTPVPVAGRAVLQVTVRAPILGVDSQGHQPWRKAPTVGQSLVSASDISGWRSLRAVTFAGSFEGQTNVAVGVREKLPFRVLMTSERGYRHVVLDIAH